MGKSFHMYMKVITWNNVFHIFEREKILNELSQRFILICMGKSFHMYKGHHMKQCFPYFWAGKDPQWIVSKVHINLYGKIISYVYEGHHMKQCFPYCWAGKDPQWIVSKVHINLYGKIISYVYEGHHTKQCFPYCWARKDPRWIVSKVHINLYGKIISYVRSSSHETMFSIFLSGERSSMNCLKGSY